MSGARATSGATKKGKGCEQAVTIAVCGRFHYHNYVGTLMAEGIVGRFLMSHKRLDGLERFKDRIINSWLKEYLVRAHLRVLGDRGVYQLFPLYHAMWDISCAYRIGRPKMLHFMAHGTSSRLLKVARRRGAFILAEAVNSHPRNCFDCTNRERPHYGLAMRQGLPYIYKQIETELTVADHILAPSWFVKDSLTEKGIPAEKISVINYGSNTSRFVANPMLKRTRRLYDGKLKGLCVAQVTSRKGHFYLVEAARKLADVPVHFTCIGRVSNEYLKFVSTAPSNVSFLSPRPQVELLEFYQAADVFLLPSVEEGLAIVLGEAMAAGLAVVATKNSGAEDIIETGKSGIIIASHDSDEIVRTIQSLIGQHNLIDRLGAHASQRARELNSWDQYAKQLKALYQRLYESNNDRHRPQA